MAEIKHARGALEAGRLDEAYQLALTPEVRKQYKAQALIRELVDGLLDRAKRHLAALQPEQALEDVERAARLGGNLVSVVSLREEILGILKVEQGERSLARSELAEARRYMQRGEYDQAEQVLDQIVGNAQDVRRLRQELEQGRITLKDTLQDTRTQLDLGNVELALEALLAIKDIQAHPEVLHLRKEALEQTLTQAQDAFTRGRLGHVRKLLKVCRPYAEHSMQAQDLARGLAFCEKASNAIQQNNFDEAHQVLKRLVHLQLDVVWVKEAQHALAELQAAKMQLLDGPLSTVTIEGQNIGASNGARPKLWDTVTAAKPANVARSVDPSTTLRLQINGVGSFLLIRKSIISFGAARSSRKPDIGLLAVSGIPTARIERLQDDYFLRGDGTAQVNGRSQADTLLRSGDKIELARNARFTFQLPNPASTTAVFALSSGTRLPRADIRKIILFDDALVLGPAASAHIRCPDLAREIVLVYRDGEVLAQLRRGGERTNVPLALNQTIEVDALSMVLSGQD